MAITTKCFVETLCKPKRFLTFDFGDFAIVFTNHRNRGNRVDICLGDDYVERFMRFCEAMNTREDCKLDSIQIKGGNFRYIQDACLKFHSQSTSRSFSKLYYLLEANFPKQVKLYGI